jgi:hypothetical protein
MWMFDPVSALELASQRSREEQERARRWRLERELRLADGGRGLLPRRPSAVRRVVAAPIRFASSATHGVSELTCTLATRIEGRTA